ncbi:putative peptidase S10, serine carboxypeptidase, alpha/Beta hydrolase [Helianthus annuus]|uniref:Peptidase S10, serine carboxypeptidase, alpha/Beta hydrolase n=1 Tax=Helianthus annuus TaxID=4232 RepID=A0A9K3N4Q6_HELAN|nr:putative peptidase S10, serine carboxypeptidase, alpha/Beta hydrolase [Helianthus annuus]KAJ0514184.1 putative peptidase S10, serine carboxypeptidase, alpha/Beta hydrolase [Helianthus annuus]
MNDTLSVIHTYDFLKKWLVDHIGFLSNPLYLGGDSYSGILVPMIAQEIYDGTHKFLISIELLVQIKNANFICKYMEQTYRVEARIIYKE